MAIPLCHTQSITQKKSCTHMSHRHANTALFIIFSRDTHNLLVIRKVATYMQAIHIVTAFYP